MFAALVLERDPPGLRDLPRELMTWCQNSGGFAAIALLVFVIVWILGAVRIDRERIPGWLHLSFTLGVLGTAFSYVVFFATLGLSAGKQQASGLTAAQSF